jgi:hypothetical protein
VSTIPRLAVATAAVALTATAAASAAQAPVVSGQHVSPRHTAPTAIPGTGIRAGAALPHGARLVYREVQLTGSRQKPTFTLTAPSGTRLRALAVREGQAVGFVVVSKTTYAGKRTVEVRAFLAPRRSEGHGRIYALVR